MKNYDNFYFFGNSFSHRGTWTSILSDRYGKNNAEYPVVGGKYNLLQQLEQHLSSHRINAESVYFYYAGGYDARDAFIGAYTIFSALYSNIYALNAQREDYRTTEQHLCKAFKDMVMQCVSKYNPYVCDSPDKIDDPVTKSMLREMGNSINSLFLPPSFIGIEGNDIQGLYLKIQEVQEFTQKLIAKGATHIVIVNQIALGYIDHDNYQINSPCDIRPESESINILWNRELDTIKENSNKKVKIVEWHSEFANLLLLHDIADLIQGNHLSPLANQYLAEQVEGIL